MFAIFLLRLLNCKSAICYYCRFKVHNVRIFCCVTNSLRFVISCDIRSLLLPFYLLNDNKDVEMLG